MIMHKHIQFVAQSPSYQRMEGKLEEKSIGLNVFEMWLYPSIFYFNAKSILLNEIRHSGKKK